MATEKKMDEFEQSFMDGPPAGAEVSEDQAFGITADEDGGAEATGEPAAVVIVEEEKGGATGPTEDPAAAAEAKAVTDEANAAASASAGAESTATKEAAGGITPPAEGGEAVAAATNVEGEEVAPGATDAPHGEMPMGDGGLDDLSDVPPEDMQKAKSWQGRLKKIEAELKAKAGADAVGTDEVAAPAADAIEQVADKAAATGDTDLAQAAQEVSDQVESGEITPEQAMASLAEDFGEGFVKMIETIARAAAGKAADEKIGGVSKNVEDVIAHIKNGADRAHFEEIHGMHPDFMELSGTPEFQAFVEAQGAQAIVEGGSAKEINQLLSSFKDQAAGAGEPGAEVPTAGPADEATLGQDAVAAAESAADEEVLDDAEGVRSGGLRLPEQPKAGSDDFEEAWKEFA
jgi:hypothetical protein